MKFKAFLLLSLGSVGAYYGANFPIVDTPEIKVSKNYFTSSYTMELEGVTMKFDKRYEKELAPAMDVLHSLAKLANKIDENNVQDEKQVEEIKTQLSKSLNKAFK